MSLNFKNWIELSERLYLDRVERKTRLGESCEKTWRELWERLGFKITVRKTWVGVSSENTRFRFDFSQCTGHIPWVVLWAQETSTNSWSRFCTVNWRPSVSNYQLSHKRSGVWTAELRGGRRVCCHCAWPWPQILELWERLGLETVLSALYATVILFDKLPASLCTQTLQLTLPDSTQSQTRHSLVSHQLTLYLFKIVETLQVFPEVFLISVFVIHLSWFEGLYTPITNHSAQIPL